MQRQLGEKFEIDKIKVIAYINNNGTIHYRSSCSIYCELEDRCNPRYRNLIGCINDCSINESNQRNIFIHLI